MELENQKNQKTESINKKENKENKNVQKFQDYIWRQKLTNTKLKTQK